MRISAGGTIRHVPERVAEPALLGSSARMQAVRERLRTLAVVPWPVRIEGPTGSGKGLAARFLHAASRRAGGLFVSQSLTLLPPGLELARLVGWARGAFTGAAAESPGAFESAHGGTLFLDELACAGPEVQAALLQLLEDGEVRRLGEPRPRRLDVRLVFATNTNLEDAVGSGQFREDLYHRLGSLVVRMPALREHADDIPEIAAAILARRAAEAGLEPPRLSAHDLAGLLALDWPGNVRELENALLHLLAVGALPESLAAPPEGWRAWLEESLLRHGGNKTAVARQLGISRRTVYRALATPERSPTRDRQPSERPVRANGNCSIGKLCHVTLGGVP
jgi:DNA-binding NtrC family response regulator